MPAETKSYNPWPGGTSGESAVVSKSAAFWDFPTWGTVKYASALSHDLMDLVPGYNLQDNNVPLQDGDTVLLYGMGDASLNGLYQIESGGPVRIPTASQTGNFTTHRSVRVTDGKYAGWLFRYVGPEPANMSDPKPFLPFTESKSLP